LKQNAIAFHCLILVIVVFTQVVFNTRERSIITALA